MTQKPLGIQSFRASFAGDQVSPGGPSTGDQPCESKQNGSRQSAELLSSQASASFNAYGLKRHSNVLYKSHSTSPIINNAAGPC